MANSNLESSFGGYGINVNLKSKVNEDMGRSINPMDKVAMLESIINLKSDKGQKE